MGQDNPLVTQITGNNLSLEEQKQLVDHIFEQSRKNTYRMMLTIFPAMIIMILSVLGGVFYFTGIWKLSLRFSLSPLTPS